MGNDSWPLVIVVLTVHDFIVVLGDRKNQVASQGRLYTFINFPATYSSFYLHSITNPISNNHTIQKEKNIYQLYSIDFSMKQKKKSLKNFFLSFNILTQQFLIKTWGILFFFSFHFTWKRRPWMLKWFHTVIHIEFWR